MASGSGAQVPEERTFLSEGNVLVTNARIVSSGQTYAMAGVTSVQVLVEPASNTGPVLCILGGLLLIVVSIGSKAILTGVLGAGLIVAGIQYLRSLKSTHNLILRTSSGEIRAFSSVDSAYIARILEAINNAIVARS